MSGGAMVVMNMSDRGVHGEGADMESAGCLPGEMGVTEAKERGDDWCAPQAAGRVWFDCECNVQGLWKFGL